MKSFLSAMGQRWSIPIGNCLRKVSYSAWDRSAAYRQETVHERFPIRHGTEAQHTDRKLVVRSFLSGMGQKFSILTGNCLRIVSYPAWDRGGAHRQETVCKRFSIRHGAGVEHSDRKLLAKGFLSGMTQWWNTPTGNLFSTKIPRRWGRGRGFILLPG